MGNLPGAVKGLVFCPLRQWFGRVVVGVTFVGLSATFSARYLWEPQLSVGMVAPSDIKATKTIKVLDREATRQAKEQAHRQVPQVYLAIPEADRQAKNHLEELLEIGDRLREVAGKLPYVSTDTLTYKVQLYLRQYPELAWHALLRQIDLMHAQPKLFSQPVLSGFAQSNISNQAVKELLRYKTNMGNAAYRQLIDTITEARTAHKQALIKVSEGPEVYREHLLNLRDREWESDKQAVRKALNVSF
ncbi:MAG: hypothetical protein HC856_10250 [Pseudanabaena sp. RU_4_16]|nr:hypothetical protein [Pseudanabaena sp. RU_4_16]